MTGKDDLSGRNLGEFVLCERIGEGGFGAVYRCKQPTLGREAVVKVLHHRLRCRDVQLQRFLREAQLASRLDHPYAAHIYAFGAEESDGILWIAMELVHGLTLTQWLADRGPMPLAQLVPFFEHVAEVVQTAHERGIVHRDLKPSNVMVIERAGRLLPKLLDFGVAKLLDDSLLPESTPHTMKRLRALVVERLPDEILKELRVGPSTVTFDSPPPEHGGRSRLTPDHATLGTPSYMAPEQWSSAVTVGPAADLYALAVVAFEALTGHRPFEATSRGELVRLHRHGQVPALGPAFPPALDPMFQRALAKRPEDRWPTALELAGALRAASGIGDSGPAPPRIDAAVRDAWLAAAPQPLAESVAVLDGARNAHQAHLATQELAHNLLRYLLAVALATRAQPREGPDDTELLELVRALDRRALDTDERVRLLRLLVRPLTGRRSAHPIPELVDLVTPDPDGTDGLDPILALHAPLDHAGAEDAVRSRLCRLLPALTQLLQRTTFVLDHVLVVPRHHAAEQWTGRHQPRALANVVDGELVEGHPVLLDRNGRVCVDLWPLVQAVPPTEGAEAELCVFDGRGRHDAIARDWVATHVIAPIETRTRMREQLRVTARQWQDRGSPDALLWRGEILAELERWMRHTAGAASLGELEAAFATASCRAGRHARWARRLLIGASLATVLGMVGYRDVLNERMADQIAEQAEVEQGRQALLHDDLGEAQQHLAEAYRRGDHAPGTAFMLARALQPRLAEQARFTATAGRVWSAAFSPDGQAIVTADDQAAQVWNARTHQLLFTLPHGDTVYDARYTGDGARIVTGGGDGAVRIWDATTGALVRALRHGGPPRRYYATALSPDGTRIAAIDTLGAVVHVWDAASGAPLAELPSDASGVPALAFSADGRWLASSGGDDVRVFDVRTWSEALVIAGPHIRTLSFDPTGPRLATGSADGDASIWEIPSGTRTRHREIGDPVNAIAFSPDGQLVTTGGESGAVQVWRATTGTLQSQFSAMPGRVFTVEFDPASKLVVAASNRGAVVVADAALGLSETVLEGAHGAIMSAHFDPTSRRVVGASWDGTARVWDATSPYREWSAPPVADDCGLVASLEPDGRFLAIGCRDHATRVWDTARGQLLAELPSVTPVDGDFTSAFPAVDASGDRAAVARGNTVELYELPGGRLLSTIRHSAPVNAVAFGPAGHDLVSGATDGTLLVTRDDRAPIALPATSDGVDATAILPDGRVVAADAHGRLRFYDPDRKTLLVDLELPTRVRMLRWSPDSLRLITIPSYTGKAAPPVLWDLAHYRRLAQLEAHTGGVYSARFTASGVVTVGGDGAARRWESDTGRLLETYRSPSGFLTDAAIDPDRAMIIASGSGGMLWFWDLSTGRPLWKLRAHRSLAIGIHFEGSALVTRGFAGEVSRWVLPKPERVVEAMQAR